MSVLIFSAQLVLPSFNLANGNGVIGEVCRGAWGGAKPPKLCVTEVIKTAKR